MQKGEQVGNVVRPHTLEAFAKNVRGLPHSKTLALFFGMIRTLITARNYDNSGDYAG